MLKTPEAGVRSSEHDSEEVAGLSISRPDKLPRAQGRRSIIHYGSRLAHLSAFEWLLLFRMSHLLAAFLVAQRKVSLPDLMAKFDADPVEPGRPRISPGRLVYLVTGLVRFTLRDRFCMKRSILIFHFLRKWGYDARILFGVVKNSEGLQGHAWVELNGRPLAERGDPRLRYTVTYSYPA